MNHPTRKLEWTDEATQAFSKIKDLISLQAQLFFANDDDLIFLLTDASDYGIGGYLYQLVDGKALPQVFNWCPIKMEYDTKRSLRLLLLYN